jgi:hypothetical protein
MPVPPTAAPGSERGRTALIISHDHRFIFIKTHKTAGTSVEVLLAPYAADGVVTAVMPPVRGHEPHDDRGYFNVLPELARIARGRMPADGLDAPRQVKRLLTQLKRRKRYRNHMDATRVRDRVGARTWDRYFTFCFERDPWTKTVSWYHWLRSIRAIPATMSFAEMLASGPSASDWDLYAIDGRVAVDFVGRFENLEADLQKALGEIGISDAPALTHEKPRTGGPAERPAAVEFTPEIDARIATAFARELAQLGYPDRSRPGNR